MPRKASLDRFEFLCRVRAAGTAMRVVAARAVFLAGEGPTVWTQWSAVLTVVRTEPQEAPAGRGFRVAMARPEATEETWFFMAKQRRTMKATFLTKPLAGPAERVVLAGRGDPEDLEAKEVAARLVAAAGMAVPREDPDRKAPKAPTVPTANPRGNCR